MRCRILRVDFSFLILQLEVTDDDVDERDRPGTMNAVSEHVNDNVDAVRKTPAARNDGQSRTRHHEGHTNRPAEMFAGDMNAPKFGRSVGNVRKSVDGIGDGNGDDFHSRDGLVVHVEVSFTMLK